MKRSHWRFIGYERDSWVFTPIPLIQAFGVSDNHGGNWGFTIWWLFWAVEWWRTPVPRW
jgi:hypothetical protein